MDVPYLNVRHAYLPWLRVRVHLSQLQHLERRWTELLLAHALLAVVGLGETGPRTTPFAK